MRKLFAFIVVLLSSMFFINCYCQSADDSRMTAPMDSLSAAFGDLFGAGMNREMQVINPDADMQQVLKGIEYIAVADTSSDFIAGLQMGQQILQLYKDIEERCGIPFNKNIFIQHLRDGLLSSTVLSEDELRLLQDRIEPLLDRTMETTPKAISNKRAGEEYMAKLKKDKNYIFTESGIAYKVIKEGTGDYFTEADVVNILYRGRHLNGEVFDENDDGPEPFELTSVIPGISEVVQLMKPGGKVTVVIPAEQAYGAQGNSDIEPNETLIFDIEALGIQK